MRKPHLPRPPRKSVATARHPCKGGDSRQRRSLTRGTTAAWSPPITGAREREHQGGSPSTLCRFRLGEGGFRRRALLPFDFGTPSAASRSLEPFAGRLA